MNLKIYGALLASFFALFAAKAEEAVESAPLMLKDARDAQIRNLAAYQLKRRFVPMNTSDSSTLKQALEDRDKMVNESIREPEQLNRTLNLNPSLLSGKPTIYASANYLTTIVFIDKYGNPWDIEDIGIGASTFFEYKNVNPYTIWLYPKKKYKKSNFSVFLKGLVTPVVFDLEESGDRVDYTVQAKVAGVGNNSKPKEFSLSGVHGAIPKPQITHDDAILQMVDGITPNSAQVLSILVNDKPPYDMDAWMYQNFYYIRLKGKVISPNPEQLTDSTIDGFRLYKIPVISSVFIERDGVLLTANIQKI